MSFKLLSVISLSLLLRINTGQWTTGGTTLPAASAEMSAAYYDTDNKIYIVDPENQNNGLYGLITFDVTTETSTIEYRISAQCQRGGIAINNRLYMQSGSDSLNVFDLTTKVFSTSVTSYHQSPVGSGQACLAGDDNNLYILGGLGELSAANKFNQIYNLGTAQWSLGEEMSTTRRLLGCAVADSKLFAIGGWTGFTASKTVEYISTTALTTGPWTEMTALFTTGKEYISAVVHGGKIYIFGDDSFEIWIINPMASPMTLTLDSNTLSYADSGGAPVSVASTIYLFGGYDVATYELTNKWQKTTTATTTKSPSKAPTPSPISPNRGLDCSNIPHIEGQTCYLYGDPHFTTFNGETHDFQGQPESGRDSYYYVTPCAGLTKADMPFSILGHHTNWNGDVVTGLDYLTIELYESDTETYYVDFSASFQLYGPDPTDPDARVALKPGRNNQRPLGTRFRVEFIVLDGYQLTVTIDRDSNKPQQFRLKMQGENQWDGRFRMHRLWINMDLNADANAVKYKCFACGLCGEFQIATGKLETCDGGETTIIRGYGWPNTFAYDRKGASWEKKWRDDKCPIGTRRRLQSASNYEPDVSNFTYVDPCDASIVTDVISACQSARDEATTCCDIIGSDNCDAIQASCEFDACVGSGTNLSSIPSNVDKFFTSTVNLLCNIPGAETIFAPENLMEIIGQETTYKPETTEGWTVIIEGEGGSLPLWVYYVFVGVVCSCCCCCIFCCIILCKRRSKSEQKESELKSVQMGYPGNQTAVVQ